MMGIGVTQSALVQRRKHQNHGPSGPCIVSRPNALVDLRCSWCKEFDATLQLITAQGWQPSAFDLKFLKGLRISID